MKKRGKSLFLVIVVSVAIVLLLSTTIVSALSFNEFFNDLGKAIKNFFGFGEKEKGLEGELKSLGVGGSGDYSRICEEGDRICELMPSRTENFRYAINNLFHFRRGLITNNKIIPLYTLLGSGKNKCAQ